MLQFVKNQWFLFVVLVLFIALKIPHLSDAYYWDESWPYASAVHHMYKHGISLLPGAVPVDLSRGHPLFFHAAVATWLHVFGESHVAYHSFSLLISVLFIVFIYNACLRLFNKRVAILATLMVCLQVMFFVQSSLVLFEVLVAFMVLASFCFYIQEQFYLLAVSLFILFFTKESGWLAGLVIGTDILLKLLYRQYPKEKKIKGVLSVGVPALLIAAFFLLQRKMFGFFILPAYNDLMHHTWPTFFYTYRIGVLATLFTGDYRSWFFILFIALALIFSIIRKNYLAIWTIIPAIFIYYLIDDTRANGVPHHKWFYSFFQMALLISFYPLSRLMPEKKQKHFVVLIGWFALLFFSFSAVNFFSARYLMAVMIPVLIVVVAFIQFFSARLHRHLFYPITAIVVLIGLWSFYKNDSTADTGLKMYNGLEVQEDAVKYLQKVNAYDKNIASQAFMQRIHLLDPSTGFLGSEKVFKYVEWEINSHTDYVIFDNLEEPDTRYEIYAHDPFFKMVHRFQKGSEWGEIYLRVKDKN